MPKFMIMLQETFKWHKDLIEEKNEVKIVVNNL